MLVAFGSGLFGEGAILFGGVGCREGGFCALFPACAWEADEGFADDRVYIKKV